MATSRQHTLLDTLIKHIDQGVRTVCNHHHIAARPNPAETLPKPTLSHTEKRDIAGMMRINHAGEVSAQALYHGQALTARLADVKEKMQQAAEEETDHLAWCESRLQELNSQPSLLNPFWYCGSFVIGALAGLAGDKWSLGFVAETEHQVTRHLQAHLERTPKQDQKTRAILKQMEEDERQHATNALDAGGAQLPKPIRKLMQLSAKLLTKTAYYI